MARSRVNAATVFAVLFLATTACLFIFGNNVSAESGNNNTVTHGCGLPYYYRGKLPDSLVTCMAVGASFAYFQYDTDQDYTIDMGPVTPATDLGKDLIKGCAKYGGFMHLGVVDGKRGTWRKGNIRVDYDGNISLGNFDVSSIEVYDSSATPGAQNVYVSGVSNPIAHLVDFVDKDEARRRYDQWLQVADDKTDYWAGGSLGWFCWSPTIDKPPEGTLYSKTEGFVNGQKKSNNSTTTINANSANIKFEHTIYRNNDGIDGYVSEWHVVVGSDWKKDESYVTIEKGGSRMVHMDSPRTVDILPGQTRSFYQQLGYDTKASGDDSNTPAAAPKFTLDIVRPKADSISGRVRAKVNNGEVGNNSTTVINSSDGSFTISFQHELQRGNDAAGGTVDVPWSTSVSSNDSAGRKVNPGGTARSGTKTLGNNSGWQSAVSFNTETFSGTLLPGETKTFCQNLTYASVIDYAGGNRNSSTGNYCVSVRRADGALEACGENKKYGVNEGHNWGEIAVSTSYSNRQGVVITLFSDDTEVFDAGERTAKVWSKPGNDFTFEETMCEGAELPNQYRDYGKSITDKIEANRPGSEIMKGNLAYSTPMSWNNAIVRYRSSAGRDIWGGTSYTASNNSPRSGAHKVTNDYLGKTLEQKLTWTDLWIGNGGVIDPAHSGNNNATAIGRIHVPYNYKTTTRTENPLNDPYSPGTPSRTVKTFISIEERINKPANGVTPYATKSKETKWQVVSFRIDGNTDADRVQLKNDGYYGGGIINGDTDLAGVCTGWMGGSPFACQKIDSGTDIFDPGEIELESSMSIPDNVPIGTKICTVAAVWPSDSHNYDGDIIDESQEKNGMSDEEDLSSRRWKISQPTCASIAKRPTIQVRMSGAYAQNSINTSTSDRILFDTNERHRYGSWADYDLVSGKEETLGMASGAMLWGGIYPIPNGDLKYCRVSPMTFTNDRCYASEGRMVGKFGVDKSLGSSPERLYQQIIDRYTGGGPTVSVRSGEVHVIKNTGACRYNETTGKYTAVDGYGRTGNTSFVCLDNGTYYTEINGDAKTDGGGTTWGRTDGVNANTTYSTLVSGTLYIDKNFRTGDVSLSDPTKAKYSSIAEIPQRIFIAKNIKIAPNVTHLDAWLIADSIDTCYPGGGAKVSVSNCNSQLTVTGPVIAKNIALNRTYGGGRTSYTGGQLNRAFFQNENSEAAEVFKLSPTVYLWSYAQMQRYSQAVITYQRELPARY